MHEDYGFCKTYESDKGKKLEYPVYKLICLNPKLAFDSLIKEKPYKLIFTSGSLPSKEVLEKTTGLKFQK